MVYENTLYRKPLLRSSLSSRQGLFSPIHLRSEHLLKVSDFVKNGIDIKNCYSFIAANIAGIQCPGTLLKLK
jgi:hypothetical protein